MATDVDQALKDLKKRFDPAKVKKDFTFYLSLGENDSQKWTLWISTKKVEIKPGKHLEQADCLLKTDEAMFLKMADGYTPGVMEFLGGKVKTNSPELLRQFKEIFAGPAEPDAPPAKGAKK